MRLFTEQNAMYRQVCSIPALLEELVERWKEEVRFALSVEQTYQVKHLYLVGSGDSYIAAKAARQAFARLAHVDAQAVRSLEAARYLPDGWLPQPGCHNLLIAISNSGETARVVEAARAWKETGALVLAITARPDSTLGKLSDGVICTAIEPYPAAPEVRSCIATLLALLMLAIRMGENKGVMTMDEAGALRRELRGLAGRIRSVLTGQAETLKKAARLCAECGQVELIGSGPALGSAEFGVAKIYEAIGTGALAQESEEFFHLNFFRREPAKLPAILLTTADALAAGRQEELIWLLGHLGRPYFVFTDRDDGGAHTVACGEPVRELFAPLYHFALLAQMVSYMNLFLDEDYYRGHAGVWDESKFPKNSRFVAQEDGQ